MWLRIVLLDKHGRPSDRHRTDGSLCCSQTFEHERCHHRCTSCGHLHTPIPSQVLTFEHCEITNLDGPSLLLHPKGHNVHDFQKIRNVDSSDHFSRCVGPSQTRSEKSASFLDVVDDWLVLHMVESCVCRSSIVKHDGHWCPNVFRSSCSNNIRHRIAFVFYAALSEGQRVTRFQCRFPSLPLTCRFLRILLIF